MNILMLYTHDPSTTSGTIPLDLLHEFKKKGHQAKLLVNSYNPNYPADVISMETVHSMRRKHFLQRVKRRVGIVKKGLGIANEVNTDPKYHFLDLQEQKRYYHTREILKRADLKPDAIILFFVRGFLNARNIYELNKLTNAPVYLVMYDMAPLTGGCHYAWDCKGYQMSCGSCPGLYSSNPNDITFRNLAYKKKYLDRTDLHVVASTELQRILAKESTLLKNHEVHKTLIAFDKDVFRPVNKKSIRDKYGIGAEKKVIFFGAWRLYDERKGMKYLLEAIKILERKIMYDAELKGRILLLIAGTGIEHLRDDLPFEYYNLGMLDNKFGIASAYQLADVFVCPSIEDAGPTMINQSIMCGTPVVSFEMGVALDLVINGKTGYRAKLRDSNELAQGLYDILLASDFENDKMAKNCRELAMELFQPEINVENWLKFLKCTNVEVANHLPSISFKEDQ
jgi:glycosyltransferase involved in cell wall biosynthesis